MFVFNNMPNHIYVGGQQITIGRTVTQGRTKVHYLINGKKCTIYPDGSRRFSDTTEQVKEPFTIVRNNGKLPIKGSKPLITNACGFISISTLILAGTRKGNRISTRDVLDHARRLREHACLFYKNKGRTDFSGNKEMLNTDKHKEFLQHVANQHNIAIHFYIAVSSKDHHWINPDHGVRFTSRNPQYRIGILSWGMHYEPLLTPHKGTVNYLDRSRDLVDMKVLSFSPDTHALKKQEDANDAAIACVLQQEYDAYALEKKQEDDATIAYILQQQQQQQQQEQENSVANDAVIARTIAGK